MSEEQSKFADPLASHDRWTIQALKELDESAADTPVFQVPSQLTSAARLFFEDVHRSNMTLKLLTDVTAFADNAAYVSSLIVRRDGEPLPRAFDPLQPLEASPGPFRKKYFYISETVLQMIVVRIVDNFTTYLVEILRECLKAKPQILRSKENLTYESILQHKTMEELQEFLVERKVDELAYLGFAKLAEWVDDKLGISDLKSFPARAALVQVLETRNCIVHNRSRIGPKYLRALGREDLSSLIGTSISSSVELIYLANRSTGECVSLLDDLLAKKFSLSRQADLDSAKEKAPHC